jgi:endonuclease YncB( thermonuclease family)
MTTISSKRGFLPARPGPGFLVAILAVVLGTSPGWAASAVVKDAGALQLGEVTYRLDGIDAPPFDQMCIDNHADAWACGVEARDHLVTLIGDHDVHCEDLGPDKTFKKRHVAVCTIDDKTSLNQLMVRDGFALIPAGTSKGGFGEDEAGAKNDRRGMWKGCFAAPQDFRHWQKTSALLGASCRADKDREIRAVLFPDDPDMPPGCSVKAKFAIRARITGNVGIYHLQSCRTYPGLTRPDRWFCSEEDAQAAGFRRAYNCRAGSKK